MPPVGFEPTISAGEWPKTYALDRAATGTGVTILEQKQIVSADIRWQNNTLTNEMHISFGITQRRPKQ